jgi:hypothetical protein
MLLEDRISKYFVKDNDCPFHTPRLQASWDRSVKELVRDIHDLAKKGKAPTEALEASQKFFAHRAVADKRGMAGSFPDHVTVDDLRAVGMILPILPESVG